MKVYFIYTNINGYHIDTYSFGLASIIGVTKKAGHDTKAAVIKSRGEYRALLEDIRSFRPQVVGFTSVSSQFNFVNEISGMIKEIMPGAIIVCGGVHPTINPRCLIGSRTIDGIFVGESEASFTEFLNKVERGEGYKETYNFAYLEDGSLITNKLKPLVKDLDVLPFPDRLTYPFGDTLKAMGYAPFLFSKGCPYLCAYCSNHAVAKVYGLPLNYPRYRSPESSILEIEDALKHFHINRILIADDIFGLDKGWRDEFCGKYKKRIGIKFQCLLRANLIDEEFMKLLKSAGCYRISIGVESGNEWVRNTVMNRKISDDQIIKAFGLAHKYGMETNAINIIGTPGETEEMIWDTIRMNRRISPTSSGVNIFYPYKGTVLGDASFKDGMVDENLYSTFTNERRESVLKYPSEHKKKLVYFRENWEILIWPFKFEKRIIKLGRMTFLWRHLRALKRAAISVKEGLWRQVSR